MISAKKSIASLVGSPASNNELNLVEMDVRRRQFMTFSLIESNSGRNSSNSPTGGDGLIVMQNIA